MIRHIICFGDSNTHGYCADPADSEEGGRFNENERWTALLQKALGSCYLVCEEGLTGRTTAFTDPMRESMNGLESLYSCLMSHEPADLMIIMLGTNDVKERFGLEPADIAGGLAQLIRKAKSLPAWREEKPRLLVIAPPHIHSSPDPELRRKSAALAAHYRETARREGCAFLDAEGIGVFNTLDHMHLTRESHSRLAAVLAELVPELLK